VRFLDQKGNVRFGSPVFDEGRKITSAYVLRGTPFEGVLTDQLVSVKKVALLLPLCSFFLVFEMDELQRSWPHWNLATSSALG